jgi:hypothetical protein
VLPGEKALARIQERGAQPVDLAPTCTKPKARSNLKRPVPCLVAKIRLENAILSTSVGEVRVFCTAS